MHQAHKRTRYAALALLAGASLSALTAVAPVHAQETSQLGEIVVTARKRQETLLNVPVVETALPAEQLERFQTQNLRDIATLVPGLSFGESILSTGTQVSLRGIGTSALDPGVDASVSLNIDGLQLSQGLAYASGMFDVGMVEVLKGPQSLFYGKSSPGGVISIRTADPTSRFELIGRAGYEFEAREKLAELIISGPVTDSLRLRLAAQYDDQDGFYHNIATGIPALGGLSPSKSRVSPSEGYKLRGTAIWDPAGPFDARLKINQVKDRTLYAGSKQLVVCPDGLGPVNGMQFLNPNDGCKPDRDLSVVDMDPAAFPGIPNGGTPYNETTQTFGSLEMNYQLNRELTLTSTTGYYLVHSRSLLNAASTSAGAGTISAANGFHRREVTQEIRLNSDYAGPLNFTLGGFLQRGRFDDLVTIGGNARLGLPAVVQKGQKIVDIHTDSLFGQLRYKVLPNLEVALGARWSDEKRSQVGLNMITGTPQVVNMAVPKIEADNVSPELTITWRPTDDMTVFGALKRGYKSGSFNVSTPPVPNENNAFGDEKVEGGEIGLKSRWLDRQLAFNIAAYDYRYTGLQVGANVQATNGVTQTRTVNAGSARIYGIETDLAYRPEQIAGLNLRASANWNHGRYKELDNVPCYGGQTIADGCDQLFSPTANGGRGGFTAQSRSGVPLLRAPDWQVNFGFDWERPVGDGLTLVFSSNNQYSSKYLTNLGFIYYQKSYIKSDLSLALQGPEQRWEVAVIAKNLNNALTAGNCTNANNQAGLITGTQITGAVGRGPAGVDETGCFMDRGREVWVRLTFRPFN